MNLEDRRCQAICPSFGLEQFSASAYRYLSAVTRLPQFLPLGFLPDHLLLIPDHEFHDINPLEGTKPCQLILSIIGCPRAVETTRLFFSPLMDVCHRRRDRMQQACRN